MKERIILPNILTNEPQKPYPRYGDKLMPENGDVPKPPESNQNPTGKNNTGGERKPPISDEILFAKEIADFSKDYPEMKWDDWGVDLKRAMIGRWKSKKASAEKKENKTEPPKAEAGGQGGGRKPPEKPKAPPAGEGEGDDESQDAIDKSGITNPTILEAIDVINAYRDAGLSVEEAFKEAVREIAKAKGVDPSEKKLALQRIAEKSRELVEFKKTASLEERRFGQVLTLQEKEIQDPKLRKYVPEVNNLIDEVIRTGQMNEAEYEALYKQIDALQPPDGYSVTPKKNEEVSEEDASAREAKMSTFEFNKQTLKSALSRAKRSLSRVEPEVSEVVDRLARAIEAEDYDAVDNAIKNSGFNPGDQRGHYGEIIINAAETAEKMGNKDHMVEYLLEYGLERIISRADENPSDSYPQFNLYESYNIDNIIQAARKYDENGGKNPQRKREMFSYLTNLQYKRRAMHDLFQGMKDRETYVKLVTQLLRRNGLDFVEHKIAGVADVQMMYEQVLGSKFSLSKNWLSHQDFQDADAEVARELMEYEGKKSESLRKEYKDQDGKTQFRSLRKWEILRAGMVGRSLNTATERRITYGVMGELPKNLDERLRSLEFEFIARTLAPLKLIPDKFFDYGTAMRYIELSYEELKKKTDGKKDLHKYGYTVEKDGKEVEKGLYGKSQNAMAILDTGIGDLKSNSWRGRLLLLKNKDYLTAVTVVDGHDNKETIMGYLDRIKVEVENGYKEKIRGMKPDITELELKILLESEREGDNSYKSKITQEFNKEVAKVACEQRLFLGALIKNGGLGKYEVKGKDGEPVIGFDGKPMLNPDDPMLDLDGKPMLDPDGKPIFKPFLGKGEKPILGKDKKPISIDLKEEVWKNVARFLPSRIAAFLPDETKELIKTINDKMDDGETKIEWDKFKFKLFRVERARVKRDAIALNEKNKDKEYRGEVKEIDDFFDDEHLDDNERKLIKAIRELGGKHAKDFSSIVFPFTPFLDDVPETDWNNLEDNDLDRLLINDHSNFVEGWGKVTGLIANSGAKPEDIIKEFTEGFKGVSSPLGVKDTQKKFEPFINAYMRFSRENNWSKVMGTIMKWGRVPRSEAEKYNLQSRIALNEGNQLNILSTLAQNQVLSDDPTEADKNGDTQLWRVRKKNKLDIMAMVMAQFRIVSMLFGPVFAMELFKSILPDDMAKSLG